MQKLEELNRALAQLAQEGKYQQALPVATEALDLARGQFSENHAETARCMHGLGSLLLDLDDPSGARPYLDDALAVRRKVLGSDHPDTVQILTSLGGLLGVMGNLPGAQAYHEQALAIYKRVLWDDRPDAVYWPLHDRP